ncbi:MAG: AAA family ATPase [Candidatus Thorarchaeota archaeon]
MNEFLKLAKNNLSCIPVNLRTKKPLLHWAQFQKEIPRKERLERWHINKQVGIGIICGKVSGNLEIIDIDSYKYPDVDLNQLFIDNLETINSGLASSLIVEKTQSDGLHIIYRCEREIPGSMVLARRSTNGVELQKNPGEKYKTLIETRGEGAYFIAYPSSGYTLIQGSFEEIPIISHEERDLLFECAGFFNSYVEEFEIINPIKKQNTPGLTPLEDYNQRGNILPILEEAGWVVSHKKNDTIYLRRPGKINGHSATFNAIPGVFYNFSANGGVFKQNRAYSPSSVYTQLKHSGDYSAATRKLFNLGFGDRKYRISKNPTGNSPLTFVPLSTVKAEKVHFLWKPYLPQGKLTLIEGDPGMGKSWIALAIATAISLGKGLPYVDKFEPGNVLILSAEDGMADTLKPRAQAMGANCQKIIAVKEIFTLDLEGLQLLEEGITELAPKIVLIDPLVAYFGSGVDIHRANETRAIMAQLANVSEKHNCSIVGIRHLTKAGRLKSIYRGIGSIDLTAACRSVLLVGADPQNQNMRAMFHIKSNLAPLGKALGYIIEGDGDKAILSWTGYSDLTPDQILAATNDEEKSALDEAMSFLKDLLSDGPVLVRNIYKQAREIGISEITLKRAKSNLKIKSEKDTKRFDGKWYWQIP